MVTGAEPLGITDCLNYGDPTKPEQFYSLQESAKGIVAATKALNTPVISGNVSLYNETNGEAIDPTPMIGMVGLIQDLTTITTPRFKAAGDLIYLLGETGADFNGSLLQQIETGTVAGRLRPLDLKREQKLQQTVLAAIRQHLVSAAHDISDGGLAVALTEMTFHTGIGAQVKVAMPAAQLFSETQSRFLVTIPQDQQAAFETLAGAAATLIGKTGGPQLVALAEDGRIDEPISTLQTVWEESLPCLLK